MRLSFNKIGGFLCLFLILNELHLSAQDFFLVSFKDKNQTAYSISRPTEFLSPKAVQRRQKNAIEIDVDDLPISQDYLKALGHHHGIKIHTRHKWLNAVSISAESGSNIESLKALPFVDKVEVISLESGKNKKQGFNKFGIEKESLRIDYGSAWSQIGMISVDELHRRGYTGEGVLIAILDAGFRSVDTLNFFKNLWEENRIIGQWDFVDNDSNALHGGNHGMQVLSTMACQVKGRLVGSAPAANFVLYRTEDIQSERRIEEYNWAAAAEYADSIGADIINSSLGYTKFDDSTESYTYQQMDGKTAICTQAAEKAVSKGILVVNSAGNSGTNPWYYIGAPADGEHVFSIGAVASSQEIASFSSRGPNSAGVLKPNVCAQGQLTALAATTDSIGMGFSNGTSFSSPIIAGACASLMEANPNVNIRSLKLAIEQSAHLHQSPNFDYGHGIPNFLDAHDILQKGEYNLGSHDYWSSAVIWPNPAINLVHIDWVSAVSESIHLDVYNVNGAIVQSLDLSSSQGVNTYEMSTFNLNAGVYVIKIKRSNLEFTKKLVIGRK